MRAIDVGAAVAAFAFAFVLALASLGEARAAAASWVAVPAHGAARPDSAAPEPARCCKICKQGKACGNSCIMRDKVCRRPRGCACDG